MDTFFEQIVPVKKGLKGALLLVLLWIAALILSFVAFLIIAKYLGAFIGIVAVGLIFYGAYKLSQNFFIEYEYIITNGTLDVDKIIAKNSRKRILSFDIANISSIEKYNVGRVNNTNEKYTFTCNADDENAYLMCVSKEGKPRMNIVFAPNDRIKEGIVKELPKYIGNSAFK